MYYYYYCSINLEIFFCYSCVNAYDCECMCEIPVLPSTFTYHRIPKMHLLYLYMLQMHFF